MLKEQKTKNILKRKKKEKLETDTASWQKYTRHDETMKPEKVIFQEVNLRTERPFMQNRQNTQWAHLNCNINLAAETESPYCNV